MSKTFRRDVKLVRQRTDMGPTFYGYYEKPPYFSRLLRRAWEYGGPSNYEPVQLVFYSSKFFVVIVISHFQEIYTMDLFINSNFPLCWYIFYMHYEKFLFVYTLIIRDGPFDIQGGGGGLGFLVRAKIFFSDKIGARLFFSPALWAGLFFFHNRKLHLQHIGFRDYFMLNSGFRDNFMHSRQPHTQI